MLFKGKFLFFSFYTLEKFLFLLTQKGTKNQEKGYKS